MTDRSLHIDFSDMTTGMLVGADNLATPACFADNLTISPGFLIVHLFLTRPQMLTRLFLLLVSTIFGLAFALFPQTLFLNAGPGSTQPDASGLDVVELFPAPNAQTAPLTTTLRVVFSETIAVPSVHSQTLAAEGAMSGHGAGIMLISGTAMIVTPTQPFFPGEWIKVTLISGTLSVGGAQHSGSWVWQFKARAAGGHAYLYPQASVDPEPDRYVLALGDVDGDGDVDAALRADSTGLQIWTNDGSGHFAAAGVRLDLAGITAAAFADLNGDGSLDLFLTSSVSVIQQRNQVWLNNGQGDFALHWDIVKPPIASMALTLGDLDGDGDQDAFIGNDQFGTNRGNTVWLNDGTGTFVNSGQKLGISITRAVAAADLDLDGDLDVFDAVDGTFDSIWWNDGRGFFTGEEIETGFTSDVDLADLDNDGSLDLILQQYDGAAIWFNDGAGQFTDSGQILVGTWVGRNSAPGDYDGDGDQDIVQLDDHTIQLWLNDGSGQFGAPVYSSPVDCCPSLAAAVDLDGDADLDVFSLISGVKVWLNEPVFLNYLPAVARN